jgi:integrase
MKYLTPEQIDVVLKKSTNDPILSTIILLAYGHGLRASEVCYLTPKHFDMTGPGYLTIQRLKGSLKTTQPLFPRERAAVEPFLAGRQPGDRLWYMSRHAFYCRFRKLVLAAGLPEHLAHPHCLKHSTGMRAIKAGIENARQYLGHKTISSTGAYLRVSDEAAAAAVASLF